MMVTFPQAVTCGQIPGVWVDTDVTCPCRLPPLSLTSRKLREQSTEHLAARNSHFDINNAVGRYLAERPFMQLIIKDVVGAFCLCWRVSLYPDLSWLLQFTAQLLQSTEQQWLHFTNSSYHVHDNSLSPSAPSRHIVQFAYLHSILCSAD